MVVLLPPAPFRLAAAAAGLYWLGASLAELKLDFPLRELLMTELRLLLESCSSCRRPLQRCRELPALLYCPTFCFWLLPSSFWVPSWLRLLLEVMLLLLLLILTTSSVPLLLPPLLP